VPEITTSATTATAEIMANGRPMDVPPALVVGAASCAFSRASAASIRWRSRSISSAMRGMGGSL